MQTLFFTDLDSKLCHLDVTLIPINCGLLLYYLQVKGPVNKQLY